MFKNFGHEMSKVGDDRRHGAFFHGTHIYILYTCVCICIIYNTYNIYLHSYSINVLHTYNNNIIYIYIYDIQSTTDDFEVAKSFAASRCGLIFEYFTQGHSRGVEIAEFSMYPKEREFLPHARQGVLLMCC